VFKDKIFKFFYVYKKIKLENIQRKYDENVLYFMMYYDDLEIVNAIGSSTKKHKLGINIKIFIDLFLDLFCNLL
jgi:hypothetical protein